MGLFSSKKKTVVDTAVIRVSDENTLPDSVLEGAVRSVFTQTPVAESIRDTIFNSTFRNFERMYRYAEKGGYYYGLPNARMLNSSAGQAQVKAAIEADLGRLVIIDYAHFRPLNNFHAGFKIATETYGYNHETNELTALSVTVGYPVFLEDIVAIHALDSLADAEKTALGLWGTSPRGGYTPERQAQALAGLSTRVAEYSTELGAVEAVRLEYVWETEDGIQRGSIVLDLSAYDADLEYHQAKYHYATEGGTVYGYWIYNPADHLHPDLDTVFELNYTSPGTYFPFAIFRRGKVNRTDPAYRTSEEYLSTKKLLSYINIDFQEFADNVHANPGIADVEQAVLMMAVPLNTDVPVEIDYLMRYFSALEASTTFTGQTITSLASRSAGEDASYAVEIADADFRIIISFDRIEKKLVAGSIGPVDAYTSSLTTGAGSVLQPATTNSVRVLRHQLTTAVYEEVRIHNPRTRYDIYADKSVIGSADDDRLLVPLDYEICREMSILAREKLYYRALHFVANSRFTEKVKWYETGVFKAVLVIVAVVITVLSMGSTWQAIAAAASLGAGAVALTLVKVLTSMIIKGVIVNIVAQEVAQLLGPELAALVAAVAMVYGGVKAYQAGGLVAGSTASNFLQASNALIGGAQNEMKRLFSEYQADVAAFDLYRDERNAELERAQDLLGTKGLLNPFVFIGLEPLTVFGESPDHYFTRTVHAGNVGTNSLQIIQKFVDVSIKLPTIEETLGATVYGHV